MSDSLFSALRRDIDRMLCAFGLSHDDVNRTHLGDSYKGGPDGPYAPHESPLRELLDGDAEQRNEAPVSGLRSQERDEPGGRRVLPLDSVPLVRLAQRAEGDVDPAALWAALHKIAYSRGGQYELISTLREVARQEIEKVCPDATPGRTL